MKKLYVCFSCKLFLCFGCRQRPLVRPTLVWVCAVCCKPQTLKQLTSFLHTDQLLPQSSWRNLHPKIRSWVNYTCYSVYISKHQILHMFNTQARVASVSKVAQAKHLKIVNKSLYDYVSHQGLSQLVSLPLMVEKNLKHWNFCHLLN